MFMMTTLSLQQPMIIDPDSNGETILQFVSELLSKLDKLQEKAIIYKNYQKNFKVKKLCCTHQLLSCVSLCTMYAYR